MSAAVDAGHTVRASDVADVDRGRFADLVAAEWIKYRSLTSSYCWLAFLVLFALGGDAISALGMYLSPEGLATFDRLAQSFNEGVWDGLIGGAGCAGAMTLVSEQSSGLIRTTFLAVPGRGRLVAAKAVVLGSVMAVLGALLGVAALAVPQVLLSSEYHQHPLDVGGAVRNVAGCSAVLALSAVAGLAIAAVCRNVVATLLVVGTVTNALPGLLQPTGGWLSPVAKALPKHIWQAIVSNFGTMQGDTSGYVPGIVAAWIGCAVWLVLGVIVAMAVVQRRDV